MQDHTYLADDIIEIYKKHARAWTELRGEFLYEQSWLDLFLNLVPNHSNILDLGCGSGKPITDYIIGKGHFIVGVDSSDKMIEMAQKNFQHHTPQSQWLNADMRTVQFEQKFQGILAWDSFFHLKPNDQRKMFEQFAMFSEQGTVLLFTSGPSEGEALGDMFGDVLYHASLSQEEYKTLLNAHGFEIIKMIAEDPDCTGHTVWLARKV